MNATELLSQLSRSVVAGAWNRVVFSHLPSTNTLGKEIASTYLRQSYPLVPSVIVALQQTRGRGRLGREWVSPPGGIYASLVVPGDSRDGLSDLPLKLAVALCEELDRVLDAPCRLKWPNDLMVEGRKLGGILVESVGRGQRRAAVAGFGINYGVRVIDSLQEATSVLEMAARPPVLEKLAGRLIESAADAVMGEGSVAETVERYAQWSMHEEGEKLVCRTPSEVLTGVFLGFDDRGFLRLRTAGGDRTLAAGDLIENHEVTTHVR